MTDRIERRRMPRAPVPTQGNIRLELRQRVRLLDVSRSGMLIACEASLPVGARAHFRGGLAGLPFSAAIAVKRHHATPALRPLVGLGAQFVSIDEANTQRLEQFLLRSRNGGA